MIFIDKTVQEWMSKHPSLEIVERPCDHCGLVLRSTRPFVERGYAGLIAPNCACGKNRHTAMSVVTTSAQKHRDWKLLLGHLLVSDV